MKTIYTATLLFILASLTSPAYSQLWKQYTDTAKARSEQNKLDEAIELYTKAKVELQKDSAGTLSYAQVCNDMADLYSELGEDDNSEYLYLEAKQIRGRLLGEEHPEYAASCNGLGYLYSFMGKYNLAETILLQAKQIIENTIGKKNLYYAANCNNLGFLYSKLRQYEKAKLLFITAMNIRERVLGKEHLDYAETSSHLGTLYCNTFDYKKAEPLLIISKNISEKTFGKDNLDFAVHCINLGYLYILLEQWNKAEFLYLEARKVREKLLFGKDNLNYAGTSNDLGLIYRSIGLYKKAEYFYLEAKYIRERLLGNNHPSYASSCNNLGVLYMYMDHFEKSESLMLEAKHIWEIQQANYKYEYAVGCDNLALLYRYMAQYQKAETLNLEAKKVFEMDLGIDNLEYAKSCGNLAILYTLMGQYKKAESLYLKTQQIRESILGKEHSAYARICGQLGNFYLFVNEFEKAEVQLLEAKKVINKTSDAKDTFYSSILVELGILYMRLGQYEKAEQVLLEANQIEEKSLYKENTVYLKSLMGLAVVYWNFNKTEKASNFYSKALTRQSMRRKTIFKFTNESEQQTYIKEIFNVEKYYFSFITSTSYADTGFSYNISLSNRNLILSSSQHLRNSIYHSTDTSLQSKYNTWTDAKEQLAFWYAKPIADRPDYVDSLEEHANTLEKELTRLSSDFKQEQSPNEITWQTIQQNLKPNEAAIEFVKFDYYTGKRWTDSTYYVALLLTNNNPEPQLISLFESRQIEQLLDAGTPRQTIAALYTSNEGNNDSYNLIWASIEKHLTGISKVYFAPAGLLYRISFSALPINNTEVLSDKYELIQLNTTASVANPSENYITSTDNIYLYGGIQYDVDSTELKQVALAYNSSNGNSRSLPDDLERGKVWRYLPGTETEITEIQNLGKQKHYSVVSSTAATATEESIKELDGKSSPSVLHIATHGFFFPDPEEKKDSTQSAFGSEDVFKQSDNPLFRSGLLFAGANYAWNGKQIEGIQDGILTAYEVSNVYLPNTKLVVLSACETGLGDIEGNEGVYGLQRAFKMAGAKNLIMSLWEVPDESTSEFMLEFYTNIFNGQSINDAFTSTQTVMKNKYRSNPYKWAAWVLVR